MPNFTPTPTFTFASNYTSNSAPQTTSVYPPGTNPACEVAGKVITVFCLFPWFTLNCGSWYWKPITLPSIIYMMVSCINLFILAAVRNTTVNRFNQVPKLTQISSTPSQRRSLAPWLTTYPPLTTPSLLDQFPARTPFRRTLFRRTS